MCSDDCPDYTEQDFKVLDLKENSPTSSLSAIENQSPIKQYDGNATLSSLYEGCESWAPSLLDEANTIQVIVGNRPKKKFSSHLDQIPVRKTIRRDNRGQLSLY